MAAGRRAGTGCVVVLVVLVLVAVAAFLAWTWYASTPQYAALKTLQAVSDRDWPAFQRRVDVDAVVTSGVKVEVERRLGGAPEGVASAAVRAAVPPAKLALEARIRSGVPGIPQNVPLPALMAGRVVRGVSVVGDDAYVTVMTRVRGRDVPIEMRLRRDAAGWRVVEVRNAAEALGSLM